MSDDVKPWGRLSTLGIALFAMLGAQAAAVVVLTWWYGVGVARLPDFSSDGVAVTIVLFVSIPLQCALLALASQRGGSAAAYLALRWPSKGEIGFGIAAIAAFVVVGNGLSWLIGHDIVTPFQVAIYRSAMAAGWLPLLLLLVAVIVVTPIGEELLFRGFLFRGWLRGPRDVWPVIVLTAAIWAMIHVQYDWYVIGQVFVIGLLLGWLRWASGSTMLTIILHALINAEGMLETYIAVG
jgi:hypothetical protein